MSNANDYADRMIERAECILAHIEGETCPEGEACEFDGETVWDAFLDIERQGDHIRAALTLGGPNAWLVRDWGHDRLEVYWGGDSVKRSSRAVRSILDYLDC